MAPAKLTVGTNLPIHPPRGGGQLRIFGLYREIARRVPVDVVCLAPPGQPPEERVIAPGLRQILVPETAAHALAEAELHRATGVPVTDVAFPELHHHTPAFTEAVARSAVAGGLVVAAMPYVLPALLQAAPGAELWYDSQNVEADLKASMLPSNEVGRRLVAATERVEEECCRRAARVLVASGEDAVRLASRYGVATERMTLVPNGIDAGRFRFTSASERRRLRESLRLQAPVVLFIGSWHEPNLRALRRIVAFARGLPDLDFTIAGSVCLPAGGWALPANVELLGVVSDAHKQALLAIASVALNPMSEGSGTNIKMLDYLCAGVPVLTTPFGARGLGLRPGDAAVADLDAFPREIRRLVAEGGGDVEALDSRLRGAREHAEREFDWRAVAARLLAVLEPQPAGEPASAITT